MKLEVVIERRLGPAAALALSLRVAGVSAEGPPNAREAHCAAARAAAGTEFVWRFDRFADVCGNAAGAGAPQGGRGAGASGERQIPARDAWCHAPRHPFLTGAGSVKRYMTVVEEVARAALAASTGG